MFKVKVPGLNPFPPRTYGELHKVTERVYILRNITNSSFVIGDRSVAVIDTQVNRPSAEQLLRLLRTVTDKPVSHVINTHYHWDHTNGNQVFKSEGAEIVSSKLTREFMSRRAPRQKEFLAGRGFELGKDPLLPETTFEGEHRIDLGDMPLRIFFAGKAESDDASAVHVEKEGVVMAGDTVMTGSFPIFGQPVWDEGLQDGEWIETIGNLMKLKPRHVIPGHGPLAGKAEVDFLIRIERYFLDEVSRRVHQKHPIERILKEMESDLPVWMSGLPVVWGTPHYAILRVWRGLTKKGNDSEPGWQRFKPSAIPAAPARKLEEKTAGKSGLKDFLAIAAECKEGGDPALRLSVLKKAVESFPETPEALNSYAEALIEESRAEASVLEKGDYFHQARLNWDRALELAPDHAASLLGKGRYLTMMAYRGGDDPAEGMKILRRVADRKSGGREQAEAEFYLGIGYRRLGDEISAARQFKKSLELDPTFMPARLAQIPA
jgi:glyoxylase-like metal-dependent hydrolase (beta-lactamase superfamily II)